MIRIINTAVCILIIGSCSNYVRNDPEQVKNLNSTQWTIKSEPETSEAEWTIKSGSEIREIELRTK